MFKKKIIITVLLMCLFSFTLSREFFGQNAQPSQAAETPVVTGKSSINNDCDAINTKTKDYSFSEITKERDLLIADIGGLKEKISNLEDEIIEAPTQKLLDSYKKEAEENKKNPNANASSLIRPYYDPDTLSREALQERVKPLEQQLAEKNTQLRCFDLKISSYNTPEQDFKKTMSVIFAVLIGLVIFGFFILSWKDELMRRAIFSGQTGIQFLTLFSIVIAIILFGITGILQDKELAALLGGLSGYILGRYSSSQNAQASTPTPTTPAQLPPE